MKVRTSVGHESDACFELHGSDIESVYFKTFEGVKIEDPIQTKVIWPGPRATLMEHWMSQGQVAPFHRHHSEFINFLVKGRARVTLAGKQYTAETWDAWTAVPGVEHSVEALDACMVMEFFYPPGIIQNDTFLTWGAAEPATSHYFVRHSDTREQLYSLVEGTDKKAIEGEGAIAPRIVVPGPNVLLLFVTIKEGRTADHVHWHNWITCMLSGEFRVWMGGKEFVAPGGHYWGAAPGVDQTNISTQGGYTLEFKWPVPQVWLSKLKSWEAPVEQD